MTRVNVDEIEQAIDDALGTPWSVEEQPQHAPDRWVVVGYDACVARCTVRGEAEMLAKAPTWLRDACEEIRALRACVEAADGMRREAQDDESWWTHAATYDAARAKVGA